MQKTMDRLGIDEGIRDLVRQLWKHRYRTLHSCQGHPEDKHSRRHVSFMEESGDGWFEQNAGSLGFRRLNNSDCCSMYEHRTSPRVIDGKIVFAEGEYCGKCGAGINGAATYTS